jgi:multidrug efflux pump subunit AcrA (membrane-fusion protein)
MELIANSIRLAGLLVVLPGLWLSAAGMRVVVSGRIDERTRSARSLRLGIPLLILGVLMLFGGTWLANWARTQ